MVAPDLDKLNEIATKGFAVIPHMLEDLGAAGRLRELLLQCIDEDLERYGNDHVDRWMVHNLMVRGAPFARLLEHEMMHAYLSELLTPTCILYAYSSSSMPAGGANYSHRMHVDSPRLIPGYLTNVGVIFALDDFTAENGATYFLPGSFKRWEAPAEAEFLKQAERVFPKAGDAVIFNARTFHMGAVNRTPRPRHAITMNVCRSYMRQRFDYPRLVPKPVVDQLGETGRRFLGFNVRMPTSLEEYFVPESQRLYKAGQG